MAAVAWTGRRPRLHWRGAAWGRRSTTPPPAPRRAPPTPPPPPPPPRPVPAARAVIEHPRYRPPHLPFGYVGDLLDLSGAACDFQRRGRDDPDRWLLIQANWPVEVGGY